MLNEKYQAIINKLADKDEKIKHLETQLEHEKNSKPEFQPEKLVVEKEQKVIKNKTEVGIQTETEKKSSSFELDLLRNKNKRLL